MALSKFKRALQASYMERGSLIIRSLWACCLLAGAINHARTLLQHGLFWDYGYGTANPISVAYWTSLTFLDPLVAALLFIRPRFGILATVALVVTNVVHNVATIAHFAPAGEFLARASHPIILSQIAFMLVVIATARVAWVGAWSRRSGKPSPKA